MKKSKLRERAELISKDCIAVRVRLLNRIITNIYDKAMRPHGIKLNQASILTLILTRDGTGHGDLCRMLYMEKSTVSRNVDRMKKQGWVKTIRDEDNATTLLEITPEGINVLEKAHLAWEEAQEEALRCLGQDGGNALRKLSEKFWPAGMAQCE